jgi:hypothetical protein
MTDQQSCVTYLKTRGVGWDIVDEAINAYDQWMLDDDYDAMGKLHEIMRRMKERRALYHDDGGQTEGNK